MVGGQQQDTNTCTSSYSGYLCSVGHVGSMWGMYLFLLSVHLRSVCVLSSYLCIHGVGVPH